MLAELLSQLQEQQADSANPTTGLTAILELSWNSLDDFTQQIAILLSLFAPTPIPQAMLERVANAALTTAITQEAIATACDSLIQIFLLQRIDATTYRLHNPIRAYLQTKLDQSTQSDRYKQAFTQGMVAFAKRLSDPPPIAECDAFVPAIPHIAETATTWQAWLDDDSIIFPFFCLGRFYAAQGALDQAVQWYEQGLLVARNRLESEHLAIASCLTHLANFYHIQYRYQEAKPLYQEASNLLKQLLGNKHPAINISLANLDNLNRVENDQKVKSSTRLRDLITPADRLLALPPYVFARLDELKARAREQGLDLIDLGVGNPDGATPQPIVEAAIAALQNPANHGYPPFEGTASFRRAITDWYHRRYGVELDPEGEALPLLGSKEGLTHLAIAYINPGDTVLVPSPAYPTHFRGPAIAGGKIYSLILKPEQDWVIDLAAIPDSVAEQAKILYFNYPSNPTGATAPREFFEDIVAFARKHEILLVHDLCYAELAFDGYHPTSLLEISGAKEIGVEFHTLSKTYNMAGWRVGFVVGNRHIIQGLRTLKTNLDYGIFAALQVAAETALQLPDVYLHEVQARYRTRRDFLIQGLGELGWTVPKTKATMYLWVPCPPGMGSTDFALNVLQQTGVVVTPGNAFGVGGEGYVRISLIADCDRLQEALDRFKQANIWYKFTSENLRPSI